MLRILPHVTALLCAWALMLVSCTAEVTEACVAGPCNTDAGLDEIIEDKCLVIPSEADDCFANQPPKVGDIPCEVYKVLEKDPVDSGGCHDCHRSPPRNGAPFPLLTFADLQEEYPVGGERRRYQRMLEVIQVKDDPATEALEASPHMPFASAPQLECADQATLSGWLAKCAPPDEEGSLEKSGCCKGKTCEEVGATCGQAWDGCGKYIACDNDTLDDNETDLDCGGDTTKCLTRCGEGKACKTDTDCDRTLDLLCDRTTETCQLPAPT